MSSDAGSSPRFEILSTPPAVRGVDHERLIALAAQVRALPSTPNSSRAIADGLLGRERGGVASSTPRSVCTVSDISESLPRRRWTPP